MKTKKIMVLAACGLSLLFFSHAATTQAAIGIKDAKHKTVVRVNREKVKTVQEHVADKVAADQEAVVETSKAATQSKPDIKERIYKILHPDVEETAKTQISTTSDDNMIMGIAKATPDQCVRYLLKNNPYPKLNVSPQELVSYYYEEGSKNGIRPDIAFAQALKETGYFRYGGTVVPAQNNYCGLGTTSATVQGAYFATPKLGVRAHIQHLMAYATEDRPADSIVDPRYSLVRSSYGSNTLTQWKDLNGRWAVPGVGYGQSILQDYYEGILNS